MREKGEAGQRGYGASDCDRTVQIPVVKDKFASRILVAYPSRERSLSLWIIFFRDFFPVVDFIPN